MGKFLKPAGSLLMVLLLPGRGWQEPAGCWTCWQPPRANARAVVAPALPQFEAQKVNGSFPNCWAACAVLSRRRSSTEILWNNKKHLNPQVHHMSQRQERLAHTHFLCLHSPRQPCGAMACETEKFTYRKSTALDLCVCFLQPTNAEPNLILYFNFLQIHKSRRDCMQK